MRLLPREEKFFELFRSQSKLVVDAAKILAEVTRTGTGDIAAAAKKIEALEREGDQLIRDLFTRLNQTFITPIDPEDIHQLGTKLDNVLDLLEDVSHRLYAYDIGDVPKSVRDLSCLIEKCAEELVKAFDALSREENIEIHTNGLDAYEEEADTIHRDSVAALFREQAHDPIQVIKLKEILDLLEATVDACEDVNDVLLSVAVKNS